MTIRAAFHGLPAALLLMAGSACGATAELPGCCDTHTIRGSDIPADAPRFDQFPAYSPAEGKPAAPDVHSHPLSRMFRTEIRKGARQGPNFAGRYTLVHWGCGSDCLQFAIIDSRSGKVHHPPNFRTYQSWNIDDSAFAASRGKEPAGISFNPDSRLLVVAGGINDDPRLRGISYFVWTQDSLRRIRFSHRE